MNKEDFLEKCKKEHENIKARNPDKVGFVFRGWLTGPANEAAIKSIWKNTKTAMIEIADHLQDNTWLPYDVMLKASKEVAETVQEEAEDEPLDDYIYCDEKDHFFDHTNTCLICGFKKGIERPNKKIEEDKIGFKCETVEAFEAKAEKAWHHIMTHLGRGTKRGRFGEWLRFRKNDCIRFYGSMSEAEEILFDKFDCYYTGDD